MFILFSTEPEAQEFSQQVAVSKGCVGTTQYWFAWRKHPDENLTTTSVDVSSEYTYDEEKTLEQNIQQVRDLYQVSESNEIVKELSEDWAVVEEDTSAI